MIAGTVVAGATQLGWAPALAIALQLLARPAAASPRQSRRVHEAAGHEPVRGTRLASRESPTDARGRGTRPQAAGARLRLLSSSGWTGAAGERPTCWPPGRLHRGAGGRLSQRRKTQRLAWTESPYGPDAGHRRACGGLAVRADERRDSKSGYVAYVPPGSITRGNDFIASGGDGVTLPCGSRHGADLRGSARGGRHDRNRCVRGIAGALRRRRMPLARARRRTSFDSR